MGNPLSSVGSTFLNTLLFMQEEQRREQERDEDRRWREFYGQLASNQAERAAESHALEIQEREQRLNQGRIELERYAEEADARAEFLEREGMSFATWQKMAEMEQFELQKQTQQAAASASRASAAVAYQGLEINQERHDLDMALGSLDLAAGELQLEEAQRKAADPDLRKYQQQREEMFGNLQRLNEAMESYRGLDGTLDPSRVPKELLNSIAGAQQNLFELNEKIYGRERQVLGLDKAQEPGVRGGQDGMERFRASKAEEYAEVEAAEDEARQERKRVREEKGENVSLREFFVVNENDELVATDDESLVKRMLEQAPERVLEPEKVDKHQVGSYYPARRGAAVRSDGKYDVPSLREEDKRLHSKPRYPIGLSGFG